MKKIQREETPAERRDRSRDLVAKMVAERTEMFAIFCRLAGVDPYASEAKAPKTNKATQKLLQEFCQILVDYIAAGHFALYERIANGTERRNDVLALAERHYPRIAETAESALTFNDKYDCGDHCEALNDLHQDLDHLGKELAERIELEDKLIQALG
jgi:regulator of sigma D